MERPFREAIKVRCRSAGKHTVASGRCYEALRTQHCQWSKTLPRALGLQEGFQGSFSSGISFRAFLLFSNHSEPLIENQEARRLCATT